MMIAKTKKAKAKKLYSRTCTQEYELNRSNKFHICEKEFDEYDNEDNKDMSKIKDIRYYSGDYRGPAHIKCSSKYQKELEIPICFHNGSGYDYHFIIKELAKEVDGWECIGDNSEKYITFKAIFNGKKEAYKLKFIDTFRFTFGSLKNLLDNLTELNKCKNWDRECNDYKRKNNVLVYHYKKCNKKPCNSIDKLIERCQNIQIEIYRNNRNIQCVIMI